MTRTVRTLDRYRLDVPDEVMRDLAAAADAVDDLEQQARDVGALIDQALEQLHAHLPHEERMQLVRELWPGDEENER